MLVYTVSDQSGDFALLNAHNVFSKTSYFTVVTSPKSTNATITATRTGKEKRNFQRLLFYKV